MTLTLADALASGRLPEFIAQAERDGRGLADGAEFDALVGRVIKAPPTSRSNIPFTRSRWFTRNANSLR